MDKPIIFFDLDGTILDMRDRTYFVYRDIMEENGRKFLSKNLFLKMRGEKTPLQNILRKTKSEDLLSDYEKEFTERIESRHYLLFDKLFAGSKEILRYLKRNHRLFLTTARIKRKNMISQLEDLGIYVFFEKIFTPRAGTVFSGSDFKSRVVSKYKNKESTIIGDSEKDLEAGKKNNIKTIAVASGLRSEKFLRKYKPDFIIKDISFLKKII